MDKLSSNSKQEKATGQKEDFERLLNQSSKIDISVNNTHLQKLISKNYSDQFLNNAIFRKAMDIIDLSMEEINENMYLYAISEVCKVYEERVKKSQDIQNYWEYKLNKALKTILDYQSKLEAANKKAAK